MLEWLINFATGGDENVMKFEFSDRDAGAVRASSYRPSLGALSLPQILLNGDVRRALKLPSLP